MRNVIVLGINGHIGHEVARAFAAAGWQVGGFGRSNKHPIAGVRFHKGDADSVADMRAAVAGYDVIVDALHLPYDKWGNGAMETLHTRILEAMGPTGKTLLFPGTIYSYAASLRHATPDAPQVPPTPRGEIRKRTEAILEAAARRGDVQALIIRAGDFYGPGTTGDWFDQIMLREAGKGRFAMMGDKGIGHSWAYLPDLARAFVKVAEHRAELGAFENMHFAGHYVTPEEMADAVVAAAPVPLKVSRFPRFLLTIMGFADPIIRDVAKMGYLSENSMQLEDPRLDSLLGPNFVTPFQEAVATTIAPFFHPGQKVAA